MIETSSGLSLKSSAIFGHLRTVLEIVRKRSCNFGRLRKSLESERKSSKNRQKVVINMSI